jgi:hypothetical protein
MPLILFLVLATHLANIPTLQEILRELGALLFVTGVITVLWDLFGKRALLDETLAKVGLSTDIEAAGLSGIQPLFQSDELEWDSYFSTGKSLELFFISAHGWTSNQFERVERRRVRLRASLS